MSEHENCPHCELLARRRAFCDDVGPVSAIEETALFRRLFDLTIGALAEMVAQAPDPDIRVAWVRRADHIFRAQEAARPPSAGASVTKH